MFIKWNKNLKRLSCSIFKHKWFVIDNEFMSAKCCENCGRTEYLLKSLMEYPY